MSIFSSSNYIIYIAPRTFCIFPKISLCRGLFGKVSLSSAGRQQKPTNDKLLRINYHHHSSFPTLTESAIWILALHVMRYFQRASIISKSKSFPHCLNWNFQKVLLRQQPALTCIVRQLFISTVGNFLTAWPHYVSFFSLILSFIGDVPRYFLILWFSI